MNSPLVSVIITVYNGEKFLEEAINSVYNQTYKNLELIIVNDGSVDNSESIVKKLEKKLKNRFINFVYVYQQNQGVAGATNRGISISSGKYIIHLAQDDIQEPDLVEELVNTIENLDESYCMVCADAKFIDENSKEIFIGIDGKISYEKTKNSFNSFLDFTTYYRDFDIEKDFGKYETLLLGNYIPINASIIRKKHIEDVGMFSVGNYIEDWDLWLKLSKKYRFYLKKIPLLKYRWHENNTSKVYREKLLISSVETLFREYPYVMETDLLDIWNSACKMNLNFLKEETKNPKIKLLAKKILDDITDFHKNKKLLEKIKAYQS